MPELPEVETIRRTLEASILGMRVASVVQNRADVLRSHDDTASNATQADALLRRGTIASTHRHGKELALIAEDGRCLCIHLGMSGQVRILESQRDLRVLSHVHVVWKLTRGTETRWLAFRDVRRFGGLWGLPSRDVASAERWSRLGPDALGVRASVLKQAGKASIRAVKAMLLDQRVLAGVGNIYADEALFRAGIDPRRPCDTIRPKEWTTLAAAIRTTLVNAVRQRGSTLRDYADSNGVAGAAQLSHAVYGRAGEPCRTCGLALTGIRLAQRSTVFCSACQR